MKTTLSTIIILFVAILFSCTDSNRSDKPIPPKKKPFVFAREPDDSARYKHLKYDFYLSNNGQLCERKLAMATDSLCNCRFEVYYDSTFSIHTEDVVLKVPLNTIVDIESFVSLDSSEYSKDKSRVFYFHGNSDGGNRVIADKADPATFKRLCEYRWGIDKDNVFYKGDILEGLNIKNLRILFPPDTSDPFIWYIKDDKNVFFENKIVPGADPKTFKIVSGQEWDAEDKNYKYQT